MAHLIMAKNVNDAALRSASLVRNYGTPIVSDKGEVISVRRVLTEIADSSNPWLVLRGRNNNIYATVAETLWFLAGSNNVTRFLSTLLPRATDFSDDGTNWRAGYPERIIAFDQMQSVVDRLKQSNNSRQAVVSIHLPQMDTDESMLRVYGTKDTRDQACNTALYFAIENGKLNIHVSNRSNDLIWGAFSINYQEFSFLQKVVAAMVGVEVGVYTVYQNDLHVYTSKPVAKSQFEAMVDPSPDDMVFNQYGMGFSDYFDLGSATDLKWSGIVGMFSDVIDSIVTGNSTDNNSTLKVLNKYNIDPESVIATMAHASEVYLKAKLNPSSKFTISYPDCTAIGFALEQSKFTPPNVTLSSY